MSWHLKKKFEVWLRATHIRMSLIYMESKADKFHLKSLKVFCWFFSSKNFFCVFWMDELLLVWFWVWENVSREMNDLLKTFSYFCWNFSCSPAGLLNKILVFKSFRKGWKINFKVSYSIGFDCFKLLNVNLSSLIYASYRIETFLINLPENLLLKIC